MKTNLTLAALLITVVVAGCASPVKVAMYDPSVRNKSDHVEVFDETHLIQKPYREIALLTCEGNFSEEAEMTQALIDKARMIGADAVIILPRANYREGFGPFGGGDAKSVYRAKAVAYKAPE